MKIEFRDQIYTTIPAIENKSCEGCAFLAWEEGICTALIPIYKVCTDPNKVWQYSNTHSEIFNL